MSNLIRRQDVLRICDKYNGHGWVWSMIRKEVEELSPVEPKTGNWIYKPMEGQFCSECDEPCVWKFNYCPNCGAKMVEPQESEISNEQR